MQLTQLYGERELLAVANSRHGPESESPDEGRIEFHDHLDSAATAADFLRRQGAHIPPGSPGRAQLAALREIRDAARALAREDGLHDWERRTQRLLDRTTFRLDTDGNLIAPKGGWDRFVAGLLPELIELRKHRDTLKLCGNDGCGWLFVDRSKNSSRVWCDMSSCGNRMKVRRFRRAHAQPATS